VNNVESDLAVDGQKRLLADDFTFREVSTTAGNVLLLDCALGTKIFGESSGGLECQSTDHDARSEPIETIACVNQW